MEAETTPAIGASRRRIIKRPRLTRILDESGARIILLVAPAGYGKTTLAHEWLDSKRSAWYRGTPASADVAALAVGLANAASEIVPGAGDRMRQRLRATDRPDEDARVLAEMLAEDLVGWPDDAWLVIDDYQFAKDSPACEDFVEDLCVAPRFRLLVATRRRPRWATARRRLYGELKEVDRDVLAMSGEETAELLHGLRADASRVYADTGGWPAVIGLAALTGSLPLPSESIPQELYEYFAEELFQAAEPGIRWGLCQLAIPPLLDRDLANRIFGPRTAELLLGQAVRLGILNPERQHFELHPLLRRFLHSKLDEFGPSSIRTVVSSVGTALVDRGDWDHAFLVADTFGDSGLLTNLVTAAWEDLLIQGRVATLANWLDRADELHARSPMFDFVGAEVALRESAYNRAERLALAAAHAFGPDHSLTSRAFFRAGQSAHFQARESVAFEHQCHARLTAQTDSDYANALWGEFISGLELERADTPDVLHELVSLGSPSPTDSARAAAGHLFLALRRGTGLSQADLEVASVIEHVDDPLIRLSFIHAYGGALVFTAQYEQALTTIERQISDLEKYGLSFAVPHSYLLQAAAFQGLRLYTDASKALDMVENTGTDEPYASASTGTVRALISLALNDVEAALGFLESQSYDEALPAMRAECLACEALAHAVGGNVEAANTFAEKATEISTAIEPRVLATFATGIALLKIEEKRAEERLLEAFALVCRSSNFNNAVRVYRICPAVAGILATRPEARIELGRLMESVDDFSLAKSLGLLTRRTKRGDREDLSPREHEVYELLAQGLSNREIANVLFISEATAKVHVRHILEKLGAKSRTEAVARGRNANA
jgi:LuxR family transcriptional regulator, maltose regulon positive regulatory protein